VLTVTSDRDAALPLFKSVSDLIADSVRTMISCPWRTGTYRSSSSAHCGRLMERFGVAMPFIPWDCIRERSARPSASQKSIRKTSDVAPLPNLALYENQARRLRRRGPRRQRRRSALGRPARRTPGHAARLDRSTRLIRHADLTALTAALRRDWRSSQASGTMAVHPGRPVRADRVPAIHRSASGRTSPSGEAPVQSGSRAGT
jgi:hypothetical protein